MTVGFSSYSSRDKRQVGELNYSRGLQGCEELGVLDSMRIPEEGQVRLVSKEDGRTGGDWIFHKLCASG